MERHESMSRARSSLAALMLLTVLLAASWPSQGISHGSATLGSPARTEVLSYEVVFEEPEVVELEGGCLVRIPGCGLTAEPGAPLLPRRTVAALLPPGGKPLNVTVEALDGRELPGTYDVLLAPEPRLLGDPAAPLGGPEGVGDLGLGVYPGRLYELGTRVQVWRGFRLLPLTLFPVQYDLAEGKLTFYSRFEITIVVERAEAEPARPNSAILRALRELALNPEVLDEYEIAPGSGKGYLIITRPLFEGAANQLKALLEGEGFTVHVEYVDDIVDEYEGTDVPEKIRNCIRYYYENYDYEDLYVLLLGDADPDDATAGYTLDKDWEVPTRYVYNPDPDDGYDEYYTGLPNDLTPTDYYYAGLDGTWDDDGDGYYGERPENSGAGVDEADWLAEVWVGRLPVRTAGQASAFVGKLEDYLSGLREREKPMLLLGAHLYDSDPDDYTDGAWLCEKVAEFYPPEVTKRRLYENEGNLTYGNVVNEINTWDPEFVCSASHGSPGGLWLYWTDETFADRYTPDYVANTGLVWYAMACLSGAFDIDEDSKGTCFSEAMARDADGSSVAHAGATRVTWGYISEWFLYGLAGMQGWLFWYFLSRAGPEGPGEALYTADAQYYFIWQPYVENREVDRKVLFAEMLSGDPALPTARGSATYYGPPERQIGEEVDVEGWGFAPNAGISVYLERFHWDTYEHERIFVGEDATDAEGHFYTTFTVPEQVELGVWYDVMVADEKGNYIYAGSIYMKECQLILKPDRGHGSFLVNATGLGFAPNSAVDLYMVNILLAEFNTDDNGRFTGFFIVPSANPGAYEVRAVDEYGHEATRTLYVIDVTPLSVLIDVGSIHFRGERAEFYILTLYNGTRVDAEITSAKLYRGGQFLADLTGSVGRVALGLYRVTYTIPSDAPTGTYTLVAEAHYTDDFVDSRGAGLRSFLVSPTFQRWNITLEDIRGDVATIKTDVYEIEMDLDELREMLEDVNATLVEVRGDVAVIKANLTYISAKLDVLNATLVTLIEDSKGEVLAAIDTAVGTIRADLGTVLELLDAIKSTLGEVAEDVEAIRVTIEGWTGATATVAGRSLLVLTTSELVEGPEVLDSAILRLRVAGPPGTSGEVVLVVQKAILRALGASIEDVVALVDKVPVELSWSDEGTYYVLRLSYTHPADEVVIHLRGRLDDDGDGLANWEEFARGLDAQSPDTDGDLWPDGTDPWPKDPTMPNVPVGVSAGAVATSLALFIKRRRG